MVNYKSISFWQQTVLNPQLDGIKDMPESELGFTDRLGEQLFKVGPGSRCFPAATEGYDWLKMDITGTSMQADFIQLHSFPRDNFTFPKRTLGSALFNTQPFVTIKHVEQQTAQQLHRRHTTAG